MGLSSPWNRLEAREPAPVSCKDSNGKKESLQILLLHRDFGVSITYSGFVIKAAILHSRSLIYFQHMTWDFRGRAEGTGEASINTYVLHQELGSHKARPWNILTRSRSYNKNTLHWNRYLGRILI